MYNLFQELNGYIGGVKALLEAQIKQDLARKYADETMKAQRKAFDLQRRNYYEQM